MGTSSSAQAQPREIVPPWVYTVQVPPEFAADKIGACSDGMSLLGPYTVTRHRPGNFDSDGCRWERGFTSGKHTFEIVFPEPHRGSVATVGVGTAEAPLHIKGKVALVGHNKVSWGICLRTRRSYHKGAIVKKYPQSQVFLPDKFYMYLDADAGTIQFGSDTAYYGAALNNIPRSQPLYPMISCTLPNANITIIYRGKGKTENLIPVAGPVYGVQIQQTVTIHHQPHQMPPPQPVQPPPYEPPKQPPPPSSGEGEKGGPPPAASY